MLALISQFISDYWFGVPKGLKTSEGVVGVVEGILDGEKVRVFYPGKKLDEFGGGVRASWGDGGVCDRLIYFLSKKETPRSHSLISMPFLFFRYCMQYYLITLIYMFSVIFKRIPFPSPKLPNVFDKIDPLNPHQGLRFPLVFWFQKFPDSSVDHSLLLAEIAGGVPAVVVSIYCEDSSAIDKILCTIRSGAVGKIHSASSGLLGRLLRGADSDNVVLAGAGLGGKRIAEFIRMGGLPATGISCLAIWDPDSSGPQLNLLHNMAEHPPAVILTEEDAPERTEPQNLGLLQARVVSTRNFSPADRTELSFRLPDKLGGWLLKNLEISQNPHPREAYLNTVAWLVTYIRSHVLVSTSSGDEWDAVRSRRNGTRA